MARHLLRRAVRDLVLGEVCGGGCGRPAAEVCPSCAHVFVARPHAVHPLGAPASLPPTTAAAAYSGPVRSALLAYKEAGRRGLVSPLGGLLAAAIVAAVGDADALVVPVPSRRSMTRARGHDALLGIVAEAVDRRPGTEVRRLLGYTRRVVDQGGLGLAARRENLAGALRVVTTSVEPGGRTIVLVDDVCSSGATLAAAAAAVRAAGMASPVAAVVAAPPRRTGPTAVTPRSSQD